ncbi:MAG: hypothetical protein ACK55I_06495 [bacterium]
MHQARQRALRSVTGVPIDARDLGRQALGVQGRLQAGTQAVQTGAAGVIGVGQPGEVAGIDQRHATLTASTGRTAGGGHIGKGVHELRMAGPPEVQKS